MAQAAQPARRPAGPPQRPLIIPSGLSSLTDRPGEPQLAADALRQIILK